MKLIMSDDQVRRVRMRAQRLFPVRDGLSVTTAQVLADVCGVQAQDAMAAALAIRTRSRGLTYREVETARVTERSIIRTWCMRGTLHLLRTEDISWLLPILGPVFITEGRRRRAELSLDDETCARGVETMRDTLAAEGSMTRAEITQHLASRGIRLSGQAGYHLLRRAALEGAICFGPNRGKEPTYVLLEAWVKPRPALSGEEALAELARRYLQAYAPATVADLATWSGLPMGSARTAWCFIENEIVEADVSGRTAWMLRSQSDWLDEPCDSAPVIRLLPSFDTYLLGYRSRDLAVAPEHARLIHPGGGLLRPSLVVDGLAVGTWSLRRRRKCIEVVIQPFQQLLPSVKDGLPTEVNEIGQFLEQRAELILSAPAR